MFGRLGKNSKYEELPECVSLILRGGLLDESSTGLGSKHASQYRRIFSTLPELSTYQRLGTLIKLQSLFNHLLRKFFLFMADEGRGPRLPCPLDSKPLKYVHSDTALNVLLYICKGSRDTQSPFENLPRHFKTSDVLISSSETRASANKPLDSRGGRDSIPNAADFRPRIDTPKSITLSCYSLPD